MIIEDIMKMVDQGAILPAIACSVSLVFFLAVGMAVLAAFYYNFHLNKYIRKNKPEMWEKYRSPSIEVRHEYSQLLGASDDPVIQKYIHLPIWWLKRCLGTGLLISICLVIAILLYAR